MNPHPTAVDPLVSRLEQAAGSYPELWALLTEAAALIQAKHAAQTILASAPSAANEPEPGAAMNNPDEDVLCVRCGLPRREHLWTCLQQNVLVCPTAVFQPPSPPAQVAERREPQEPVTASSSVPEPPPVPVPAAPLVTVPVAPESP